MDDRFLHEMHREPRPEFARGLQSKLRAQGEASPPWVLRPAPALGVAAVVLAIASLFVFPAVRASAQAMLDLFRVHKFAAVQFDESRVEKLRALQKSGNPGELVFDHHETVLDPGPPRGYTDVGAAASEAGFTPRRPGYLPNSMALDSVYVHGAGEMRFTVSESKLRGLLDAIDLKDVSVPAGLDGKVVDLRKSPTVIQRYKSAHWTAALVQSKSPEMSLPAGLDVERLAEIGLRVIGLDAGEARRVARSTDWRTTMVVPVPLNASTFRQVTVHGQSGLLITTSGRGPGADEDHRDGTVVMWTEGDRIYAIVGNLTSSDTMEMAESVQ